MLWQLKKGVMLMLIEKIYYENQKLWVKERYLNDPFQLNRIQIVIKHIPPGVLSLLDVGCGNGLFLDVLKKQTQIKGYGVDRSKKALESATQNFSVKILESVTEALPFKNNSFDLVSALEVLEHLPYMVYEKALSEIERVSDKYIIVNVPYKENIAVVQCPYCHNKIPACFHLRVFDKPKLKRLFKQFKLVDIKFISLEPGEYVFASLYNIYCLLTRRKKNFPKKVICPICGFKDKDDAESEKHGELWEVKIKGGIKKIIFSLCRVFLPKHKQTICLYKRIDTLF